MLLVGDEALVLQLVPRPLRIVELAAALAIGLDLVDHSNRAQPQT